MMDLRKEFTSSLLSAAHEDKQLVALATDSRGSATLNAFADELPAQFVECGIAEQDAIGISAGLANAGYRPFVCGPACFYSMRSAEQIKVDVAYSNNNVKVIGVSGGISYGALGYTHHATNDVALLRAVQNLEIFIPSDGMQMRALTAYLTKSETPAYVRMGRGDVPVIYADEGAAFVPGKAIKLHDGADAAVIACGETVYHALEAAKTLDAQGIHVAVYDMPMVSHPDEEAILTAAETGLVVTVEEHSIHGGLGSAVAEVLADKRPVPVKILGLPRENLLNGTSKQVYAHYGLDKEGLTRTLRTFVEEKP